MDRSTRRRLAALFFAGVTVLAGCAHNAATNTSPALKGTYALAEGTAAVDATLLATRKNGALKLDVLQERGGTPVLAYDTEQTQLMHVVVVAEDFSTFEHVHPAFDAKTGRFVIALRTDPARRYYVYADSHPHGAGQQVFRFVVQPESVVGSPSTTPAPSYTPSALSSVAGPYTVALSSTTLKSAAPSTIDVTISRNGKPATDLQPYLGAAAHIIAINTATLEYIHVHPTLAGEAMNTMPGMEMGAGTPKAGPRMTMHLPALPVGSYKMWVQFRGGAAVYTAPVTLVVR